MNQLSQAQGELREMDMLAQQHSVLHRIHPLCKLIITLFYIIEVVSFSKYDLSGLFIMILYPVLCFQLSGIPVSLCFYKMRMVLPLICAVGLANPFLDHTPVFSAGGFLVTGGMISLITLMLKGIFSLMASFLLIATTPVDTLCAALRKIHIPNILVTLLLLTYRYVGVMLEEVSVMSEAYALRAPGQKGIHISAWGSFLGQLLLRSMDKAEELYNSMLLRGYSGEFYYADIPPLRANSVIYLLISITAILLFRIFHVSDMLGSIVMR